MVDTNAVDESEKAALKSFHSIITSLFVLAENDIIDLPTIYEFKLLLDKYHKKNAMMTSINKLISSKFLKILSDCKDNNNFALMRLSSSMVAFLILLLNTKDYYLFTLNLLSPEASTRNALITIIQSSNSVLIKRILSHLFLSEYKAMFFLNPPVTYLEMLYIEAAVFFANINNSCGIENSSEDLIHFIFESILTFKLDYEEYFKDNSIDLTEKSKMKWIICHSIIRLLLSNCKYIRDNSVFLCDYIRNLIEKDFSEIKDKYGDKYSVLFRKEIIYDDIIKHLFFFFGSEVMNKAFIEVILKNIKENEPVITTEAFEAIFKEMCSNTLKYLPNVLKFLLKTVLIQSQSFFSFSDGKIYSPIFTLLLFNFYLSPKVQEIHGLAACKYPGLIKINRLLRNICYNKQFDFKDELTPFNSLIEEYHNYLTEVFSNLLEVNYDSIESKSEIDNQLLPTKALIPKFVFDLDCTVLNHFLNGKAIIANKELFLK